MNNSNPFQKPGPFAAQSTAQPALLAPQTLATHLSPLGLGRQTAPAPALPFRRSA